MGGRVASQMVAEGLLPVSKLVFLGYPLHAPGKTDQLRDAHLYSI
jgi:predicted alpha/beta-hydrolase family hydrolase